MKADTKLTVVMCGHIFDSSSVTPSSEDFRQKPAARGGHGVLKVQIGDDVE